MSKRKNELIGILREKDASIEAMQVEIIKNKENISAREQEIEKYQREAASQQEVISAHLQHIENLKGSNRFLEGVNNDYERKIKAGVQLRKNLQDHISGLQNHIFSLENRIIALDTELIAEQKLVENYKAKLGSHTHFTDKSLKALIESYNGSCEASLSDLTERKDIFLQENINDLLMKKESVIMISEGNDVMIEADNFYYWNIEKGTKVGYSNGEPYKDDDILDIRQYYRNPSDSTKIYYREISDITVTEFMSNYVPILKNDLIGKIFALRNKQAFKRERRKSI